MTPTPVTPTPSPDAAHHARLDKFLGILERLGLVLAAVAPAIAAPFPGASAIVNAEAPVLTQVLGALVPPAA
jgi:hypothetical protein